jgi:two-component system, NarL family, sensor kinase
VSDLFVALATVVPALFFGSGGVALLPTRSRMAGALMVVTAVGVITSAMLRLGGESDAAAALLVSSLMLPGAMAVLAFPRATFRHAVEFCAWIVVAGAGAVGVYYTLKSEGGIAGSMAAVTLIALIGHGWWVLETAAEDDRQAMLWLATAAIVTGSIYGLVLVQFQIPGAVAGAFVLSALGPAMAVGIRRPGITDIRALVVRVVVFGVVAIAYVAVFVSVLRIIDNWTGGETPAGIVAIVGVLLASGFHPLSVVLRGLIDELLFGERPDPFVAASALADQIGDDPLLALRAIRGALMLPYASISIGGVEVAVSGTPVTETRRFPLALGSDETGEIVIGLRPGDLTLSAGDEQALGIVAPLVAQTLRSRRLSRDLQESRSAAITAIEEERRRLRRDLHDGLGPTLSGIAFTADAARNTITSDPAAADALLLGLRADAVAAVGEIRRLVYDMRPPSLDELGLVAALRQQVSSIRAADGRPMHVRVEANDLPPLPAAVETAAFRIATEAVLNSARHSGTDRASVHLRHKDDTLDVSVRDPGCGTSAWQPGVGLSSMRERAAEVGGTLTVTTGAEGSHVRALLPSAAPTT